MLNNIELICLLSLLVWIIFWKEGTIEFLLFKNTTLHEHIVSVVLWVYVGLSLYFIGRYYGL